MCNILLHIDFQKMKRWFCPPPSCAKIYMLNRSYNIFSIYLSCSVCYCFDSLIKGKDFRRCWNSENWSQQAGENASLLSRTHSEGILWGCLLEQSWRTFTEEVGGGVVYQISTACLDQLLSKLEQPGLCIRISLRGLWNATNAMQYSLMKLRAIPLMQTQRNISHGFLSIDAYG